MQYERKLTNMTRKCTIQDIAAYVGVTSSTVSRVLSGAPSASVVSEKTREKIRDAVEKLNYTPNVNARRLAANKSGVIGIVIPGDELTGARTALSDIIFAKAFGGAAHILTSHGYKMLLSINNKQFRDNKEYLKLFDEGSVDGMLIWGARLSDDFWQELDTRHTVFMNSYPDLQSKFSYVGTDNFESTRKTCHKLIELGHSKILYLAGDMNISISRERKAGYIQALKDADIKFRPELLIESSLVAHDANTIMEKILQEKKIKFDAVQCINDGYALYCGQTLMNHGYRVPEDIRIAGSDRVDDEFLKFRDWRFPIISYELNCFKIGESAALHVLKQISGSNKNQAMEYIPGTLVIPHCI